MTVAFGAAGAFSGGTTSLSLAFPADITAGQMLVMAVGNKYADATPSTPDDWQLLGTLTGGAGGSAGDTGVVRGSVYTRIADGTETGNQAVTVTSGNSACGRIWRVTKDAAKAWGLAFASGAKNTANTLDWSVTMSTNPGISTDDLVFAISFDNSDGFTWASEAVSATGCTFGSATERGDSASAQGDDMHMTISEHPCTAGPSTAAPVYAATLSGTATVNRPAGVSMLLVLREVTPPHGRLSLSMGVGL
jgi:MSHA biogenesis protein MshQ